MKSKARALIVLGYASPEARSKTRKRMFDLAERLGEIAGVDFGVTPVASYERLAQLIHHREIDLAWLPPITLVSLARNKRVVPLVSFHRDRGTQTRAALLLASTSHVSTYEELRGKRAAWVDRHSASGYVLPRIELAAHGIGAKEIGTERIFGSHEAVVRAIASGRADFGATYARVDASGAIVGPWSNIPGLARSVRVMTTFGEVPPDAIAARYDLDRSVHTLLVAALHGLTKSWKDREIVSDVFGASDFDTPRRAAYETLRKTVYRAFKDGLLDSDATADAATLDVAATTEQRALPANPPIVRKPPRPR
jgi:phosphate/phosphite/phosphonate ABC transporter binding protein